MRASYLIVFAVLGWAVQFSACRFAFPELQRRQDTTETGFPTLTTDTADVATSSATVESSSVTSAAPTTTTTSTGSTEQTSTSKPSSTITSVVPTASSGVASSNTFYGDELPLEPKITPALGIAGAFLVVLGGIYALVGVKSRLTQIFLSCGFLASIGATILVEYVMNPPISDAVQGGFFVAIFMTGVVFGGGALVFKDITEGFGCLLGGFCFGMWLLTLKAGGAVTSAAGKGVFIGILCAAAWALSFPKLTRPYALIGSTAFNGATAFTIGVDCFTKAGLKEFWLYIWNLNDNLFPLNTNTYPLTREIKVEIAVIVIVTIIGVLSQMRFWKVNRSKELHVEAVQQQDGQSKDAVEEALGRYLERQNEREKSAWERHYGDRLNSKRNTILWQDAHQMKRQSTISVVAVDKSTPSTSSESLEMNAFGPQRNSSAYGSKNKRQSSVTVDVIEEVEEEDDIGAAVERQKALQSLERHGEPLEKAIEIGSVSGVTKTKSVANEEEVDDAPSAAQPEKESPRAKLKRRSQRSISGLTKRLNPGYIPLGPSKSQEQLLDTQRPSSRASSVAATLDEDNEELGVGLLAVDGDDQIYNKTPDIVVSSAASDAEGFQEVPSISTKTSIAGDHVSPSISTEHIELQADSDGFELQILTSPSPESSGTSERASKEDREGGRTGSSRSQISGTTNTSAESLTKTALSQVSSQASSVVMSYRTNEWAKHIASADEPIYDEPESYGVDEEVPTRVAIASTPTSAPSSIRAGKAGVGITSQSVAGHRSFSDPDRRRSGAKPPSRSTSMQSLKVPGTRGSRGGFNPSASTSLVTMPIVENVPTEFIASKAPSVSSRRASGGSPYNLPPSQRASATRLVSNSMRPSSSGSASPYAGSVYELAQTSRFPSQQFYTPGTTTPYQQFHTPGTTTPMGTNGRRVSYESGHSIQQQSSIDALNRESLLAQWRLSQQVRMSRGGIVDPAAMEAEDRRAKMKAEKDNQRRMEEYQRTERLKKEATMDQLMRRPDMQDLHREAMRKMQANANKKLRKSVG
ncbi:hypothetical protein PV11_09051 [Exophiala sideris]|uniref:TM7S3/TM198-like domain-containing protein n=1 Tax=Exophiala sideris TaxID=1016849 RepID=A0A0D1WQ74_9EURO|nr:hypothetical protein PV11_09051 [Exophiala sideris]